jgi:hypothetical protein
MFDRQAFPKGGNTQKIVDKRAHAFFAGIQFLRTYPFHMGRVLLQGKDCRRTGIHQKGRSPGSLYEV